MSGEGYIYKKSFTGVWDIANGEFGRETLKDPITGGSGSGYGCAGFCFPRFCLGNARELIVRGAWHRADSSWRPGAFARSGIHNSGMIGGAFTNDWRDILPAKVTLDGGWLTLETQGALSGTPEIRQNLFQTGEFSILPGPMGGLDSVIYGSGTRANTRLEITNLVVEAESMCALALSTVSGIITNEFYIMNEPRFSYVSAEGQFLPFFFANDEQNTNEKLTFRDSSSGKISLKTAGTDEADLFRRWTSSATTRSATSGRRRASR